MAVLKTSTGLETAIWAVKLLLLSVGIISTVLLFKITIIPYSFNVLLSTLPSLWISFRSCLSPLYIYILLNFIIITIAASSTFQLHNQTQQPHKTADPNTTHDGGTPINTSSHIEEDDDALALTSPMSSLSRDTPKEEKSGVSVNFSGEKKSGMSVNFPKEEKYGVSVDLKFSPEISSDESCLTDSGEVTSLRKDVAEEKDEEETLDEMWKAITEGKGKEERRHLKKSETWDVAPRVVVVEKREMRKSETFKEGGGIRGSGGLRRERLPSQEELNRRVEAFIKKVNNDIRLQRQESDQRYLEMVNRGL